MGVSRFKCCTMKLYSSYPMLGIFLIILSTVRALRVVDLPEKPEDGDLWVLLVAGSNGWYNYRHQADVCHAYQIVSAHGVPEDYVCGSVRPDIFLQVLKGEKVDGAFGSGKTLNSGPKDNIFVYFADHGAKGLVAFGESVLKATELNAVIKEMYAAKKYNKMVFYVEACESGSMFKGLLPENVNVFATTASNATTSSYACYFDKARKTFLGDVYSIKWLED